MVSTSTNRGQTWSAPQEVSTAAEGYAFFQGMDVAPNGRVDLAYQALMAVNPATFGTGNAAINNWYVSKPATGSWTAPTKVSHASSDPAVSAQNNLQRKFWGDYNTLVSRNDRAWFIATDSRNGVGCPAVDAYQRYLVDNRLVIRGGMGDRIRARLGQDPAAGPGAKPAPRMDCPAQFGVRDGECA